MMYRPGFLEEMENPFPSAVLSDRTGRLEFRIQELNEKLYGLGEYLKGLVLLKKPVRVEDFKSKEVETWELKYERNLEFFSNFPSFRVCGEMEPQRGDPVPSFR